MCPPMAQMGQSGTSISILEEGGARTSRHSLASKQGGYLIALLSLDGRLLVLRYLHEFP